MTKGFWGEGGGHSGNINDEDWGLEDGEMPYSNTLGPASSTIRYLTADIGYNVLMGRVTGSRRSWAIAISRRV
jgi:hypothetical protein